MAPTRIFFLLGTLVLTAVVAACDDPYALTPPTDTNVVDTVRLYALRGTDITLGSGYDVPTKRAVRTDQPGFDFAADIDAAGAALFYPAGALGLSRDAGLVLMSVAFDAIESAPTTGYLDQTALTLSVGQVFVARSRPTFGGCTLTGALPRYGKFRVIGIDVTDRSITLETLVNQNCGYRELRPGLPVS